MSDEHVTLPVNLPPLDHLSNEELGKLRSKFSEVSREARRRAHQVIARSPSLKKPWGRSLGLTKDTPAAEREQIQRDFEKELLRVPEAFLAHAWANSLVTLDTYCRDELLRRTGSASPRGKKPRVEGESPPMIERTKPVEVPAKLPESKPPSDDEGDPVDFGFMIEAPAPGED